MSKPKPPTVRLAKPTGRPIQLRYTDPETKREVRISTRTYDVEAAKELKQQLEAKLLLGIDAKPKRRVGGPTMSWSDFREQYRELQLSTLRDKSVCDATYRLNVATRILKPRTLADVAKSDALHELQAKLLAGKDRKQPKPRSPHTVKTHMAVIMAALNWASYMGWLPAVPRIRRAKVSKLKHMKGRAITTEEFERMLCKTADVVGVEAADSWKYLLRGLWESALRLDELLHLHWIDRRYIVPTWQRGRLAVLTIPASMQKNDTEEEIPLLPGFEALLLKTPKAQRFGWVFNPISLQVKVGRRVKHQRPGSEWVGKVVSTIGEKAGVIVQPAVGDKKAKYASSHDLRRSCADRLIGAGVPEREMSRVLRHASVQTTRRHYAPGTVQQAAGVIRERLLAEKCTQVQSEG